VELREYFSIAIKWWWLFVLCAILGAGASYLVTSRQAPTYEASTLLMIGGSMDVVNPTSTEIRTSVELAQTYAELLKTRSIVQPVKDTLGLPSDAFSGSNTPSVSVTLVRDTQLMRISVVDTLPIRAAAAADELARQLILQSPSAPERQDQTYREFVRQQLAELQDEIDTLSRAIASERESGDPDRVLWLQSELSSRRSTYSDMISYLNNSATNFVEVVDTAVVPTNPIGPKTMQNTMLAAVVGLMVAGGVAFLIEYLDDSIKGQVDVEQALGLPTLGVVAQISENGAQPERIAIAHPLSSYVEGFRMLRTNLRYSLPSSSERRIFLVTSVGPAEGKSTTVANLGVVMAQAGHKTIVVDGDLRRPALHKIMRCSNEVGLSSLIVGEAVTLEQALQPTEVEGLQVLTSGIIPPNPAELLGSPRMAQLLERLSQEAEVILIDSPPLLAVTDASILASMASGTILVAEVGRTRLDACAQAMEALERVGGKLLGVVLNRLDTRRRRYYRYNYYYYTYAGYGSDGHRTKKRSLVDRLIGGVFSSSDAHGSDHRPDLN